MTSRQVIIVNGPAEGQIVELRRELIGFEWDTGDGFTRLRYDVYVLADRNSYTHVAYTGPAPRIADIRRIIQQATKEG